MAYARRVAPRRLGLWKLLPTRGPAFLVLAVSLALTGVGAGIASGYAEAQREERFHAESEQLEILLRERMAAYEQILLAGRGIFRSSEEVTRAEWRTFVDSLDLERNYPGIQGVGYAVRLAPEEVDAHVAAVRAEGFPNYSVHPEGPRETYTSIVYLEPFEGRNLRAFGYDMFSDPVRREAMERAHDTGATALSGRVRLVQETETDVQAGFLMYVPFYRPGAPVSTADERREALVGYVYSPFRAKDLMQGILGSSRPNLEFEIYDGAEPEAAALLYDSDPSTPPVRGVEGPSRTQPLTFGGRIWTLDTRPTASATSSLEAALPAIVLLGGGLTSILLFGIVWSLGTTHERATRLAAEMTRELRRSRDELQASNEALQAFTYVVSHDLKEPVRGVEAYLRVLREDHEAELPPEARHLAVRAHESTQRLSALLQSLLQLSRVNRESLVMRAVTLNDVLASDDCRLAYEHLQEETGAQVRVEAETPLLAAPSVLAQALGNLIANSISHSRARPPRVLLREAGTREGAVVVSVEDNGSGFPPGFVDRFNAGGSDAPERGFGLLIARRAVERLGGEMWLGRSERLGGAAVSFTLPPARDEPPPLTAP